MADLNERTAERETGAAPAPLGPEVEAELKRMMRSVSGACDVVRVVDPATFEARTLSSDSDEFNEPYRCYTALCKDRRCENCISMRAIEEQRPVSKFEFCDGDAYFITARPVQLGDHPHALEMVQKVSDDVGLHEGLEDLREHIQEETDHEFVDHFTGAYTRNYFDEGLEAMAGRKLAMVKVENLARINEEAGHAVGDVVLKRVAHEILAHTRIEDSVIHYEGSKFVVQFEDVDTPAFMKIIDRISDAVNAVSLEGHPDVHPEVVVAAIDEDATFGELARRALGLLADAEASGERVVMRSSDAHHHAKAAVRSAAASETLHHSPNKLMVETDELTGLSTASAIRLHLQHVIEERHSHEDGFSVVYLDVENFKQFNRTYGRDGGDMLLRFLADRIREEFPEGKAGHVSGDIFIVVTHEPEIEERVVRLHQSVASYQRRIALELKAGVAELDEAVHDSAAVIDVAKVACESIKGQYDQVVRFYDSELDQEISMNEYVVNNIERAIEEGQIKVHYQPIIRAMTGHVCDYECLCRWDDPDHGLLPPAAFVAALERFHLINKVDACVVRQACQHQADLTARGLPVVPVSVNLSRLDFQLDDIFAVVENAVAEAGIPRDMLNIEVTESAIDDDATHFAEQVDRFRNAGYEVWMDDFGSGYSSLNLLKDYRFDTLKIDMGFLAGFDDNPKSREIIVTIVDMAKKLGIRTLVEGVETKQQYRFLQRIGCEMLQGFYFSKPRAYDDDAFSEFTVENAQERAYFDQIGSVNLLGLSTADEGAEADYVTESESRSTPMALVEYRDGRYAYLSANEAYLKLIEGFAEIEGGAGPGTLDAVQDFVSHPAYRLSGALVEQLEATRAREAETVEPRTMNSEPYQVHVRHVASGPVANAFVVVPVPAA